MGNQLLCGSTKYAIKQLNFEPDFQGKVPVGQPSKFCFIRLSVARTNYILCNRGIEGAI